MKGGSKVSVFWLWRRRVGSDRKRRLKKNGAAVSTSAADIQALKMRAAQQQQSRHSQQLPTNQQLQQSAQQALETQQRCKRQQQAADAQRQRPGFSPLPRKTPS